MARTIAIAVLSVGLVGACASPDLDGVASVEHAPKKPAPIVRETPVFDIQEIGLRRLEEQQQETRASESSGGAVSPRAVRAEPAPTPLNVAEAPQDHSVELAEMPGPIELMPSEAPEAQVPPRRARDMTLAGAPKESAAPIAEPAPAEMQLAAVDHAAATPAGTARSPAASVAEERLPSLAELLAAPSASPQIGRHAVLIPIARD